MFECVIECPVRDSFGAQVRTAVANDLPHYRPEQSGFVDFLALSNIKTGERLMCISFWPFRNAEDYHLKLRQMITDMFSASFGAYDGAERYD
jgi:hypothetical protein